MAISGGVHARAPAAEASEKGGGDRGDSFTDLRAEVRGDGWLGTVVSTARRCCCCCDSLGDDRTEGKDGIHGANVSFELMRRSPDCVGRLCMWPDRGESVPTAAAAAAAPFDRDTDSGLLDSGVPDCE